MVLSTTRTLRPAALTPTCPEVGMNGCFRFATRRRDAVREFLHTACDTRGGRFQERPTGGLYAGYPRLLDRLGQWCERHEFVGDMNATTVVAYGYTAKPNGQRDPEYRTCLWYAHSAISSLPPLSLSFAAAVTCVHALAFPQIGGVLVDVARNYLTRDRVAAVFPFVRLDEADALARADIDLWCDVSERKRLPRRVRSTAAEVLDDLVRIESAKLGARLP